MHFGGIARSRKKGGAAVLFDSARIRKEVLEPLVCACLGLKGGAGATASPYLVTPLYTMK